MNLTGIKVIESPTSHHTKKNQFQVDIREAKQ